MRGAKHQFCREHIPVPLFGERRGSGNVVLIGYACARCYIELTIDYPLYLRSREYNVYGTGREAARAFAPVVYELSLQ